MNIWIWVQANLVWSLINAIVFTCWTVAAVIGFLHSRDIHKTQLAMREDQLALKELTHKAAEEMAKVFGGKAQEQITMGKDAFNEYFRQAIKKQNS